MKREKAKRPKWSIKTNFWSIVTVAAGISLIVLFGLKKNLWIELEIIVGILSFFFFLYLSYILFHGIRFDTNEKYTITWKAIDFSTVAEGSSYLDTGGSFSSVGGEGGLLGLIIGFIIDILISIIISLIIAVLIWLGINLFLTSVLVLFLPIFYLFKRSLRFVVAKGRYCYKNFTKSGLYALQATFVGSIWLYCILILGHYLSRIGLTVI